MKKLLLAILWLLTILMPSVSWAQSSEPYAVLSNDVSGGKILTFYYDDQRVAREGMLIVPFDAADRPWNEQREDITSVVFDDSFGSCTTLTSTADWFWYCHNLRSITGISNLKTDNVTNMSGMFYGCRSLTSLDVSGFKTQNVTDMSWMFYECHEVTTLDVTQFDTHNVTDMSYLFCDCKKLTTLDVSGFNTANVTNMTCMFADCNEIPSIDVSHFNTANVTDMSNMFQSCYKLASVDVSNFNTANVTTMASMFISCYEFTSLDLSSFNTANVTNMGYMFAGNHQLSTIYVSSLWSTAAVTNSDNMFDGCTSLAGGAGTSFNTGHIDATYAHIDGGTSNPGYFTNKDTPVPYAVLSSDNTTLTFYYDKRKEERNGMGVGPFTYSEYRGWHTARENITTVVFDESFANETTLTSTANWFTELSNLTTITGIRNLKTQNVTDMQFMFDHCEKLTSIDVSGFNTSKVQDMQFMFSGCYLLEDLDVSGFNTDNVKTTRLMFSACHALKNLNVSLFNTAKVTDMYGMFDACHSLESIDVSGFNTSSVENMWCMFRECRSLTSINVSGFNITNVSNMYGLFYDSYNLKTIYGANWNVSSATNASNMFYGCTSLVGGKGTVYSSDHVDYTYAHIDGGTSNPGYFTDINAPASAQDGDPFTAMNVDGVLMSFRVLSAEDKTCEIYKGYEIAAIDTETSGVMNIPETVTDSIGRQYTVTRIGHYAFLHCKNITEVTTPSTVTSIGNNAFHDCASLTNYDLPAGVTELCDRTFYETYFKHIVIPANITTIMHESFGSSSAITVTSYIQEPFALGENAFGYSTQTATLYVPVGTIDAYKATDGWKDFYRIAEDTNIQFADNIVKDICVTNWDKNGDGELSMSEAGAVTSISSVFKKQSISSFDELQYFTGLQKIDDEAFSGCTQLSSVRLPETITEIGNAVFVDCPITSIEIPSSVTTIGRQAFIGTSLETLSIPNSVTSVGISAFNATNLKSITIPSTLTNIGHSAFLNYGLEQLVVESGNPVYDSRNDCNALIETSTNTLLTGCNNTVIPEDVTSIDSEAFRWMNNLTSITIPASVEHIGEYAFDVSSYLTTIVCEREYAIDAESNIFNNYSYQVATLYVPAVGIQSYNMTSPWNLFQHIEALGSSDQPETYAVLSEANSTNTNDNTASPASHRAVTAQPMVLTFYYDTKKAERGGMSVGPFSSAEERPWHEMSERIENVIFDSAVINDTTITSTEYWFMGFSNLKNIDGLQWLNTKNVTNMSNMFHVCPSLTSLDLSSFNTAVVTHMSQMFESCHSLKVLDLSTFNTAKVYSMGGMFAACQELTTIFVGNNWSTAEVFDGGDMFTGCSNLVGGKGTSYDENHTDATYAHIDGGSSNPGYFTDKNAPADDSDIIQFADAAVKAICVQNWDTNGDGELSMNEAAAVTTLGGVFSDNQEITSFDEFQYFTGVTAIRGGEFTLCSNLKSIVFPSSVTTIGSQAFQETGFTEFTIPNTITTIEEYAFSGNIQLKSIMIPASVISIGKEAFMIYALERIEVDPNNRVYDSRDNCNAIVETATNKLIQACKTSTIPSSIEAIGENAFYWLEWTSITIPASVRSIEEYAFNSSYYTSAAPKEIICEVETPFEINSNVFWEEDYTKATLYVPESSIVAYRNTPAWSQFQNILPIGGTFDQDRKLVQWLQVGGKEYRLYKASNKNDFRTNADGWNMYRTRLTLDIISGTDTTTTVVDDGAIYCEQNLFSNAMTQCMMIDVENNKMYVFANSKTDARDYSMDGYVYISPIEQPSFTKETVFTDANWGWFSYFRGVENGQPLLSHFSYMGYYDELSKRNADGTWSTDTEDSPIASPSNRESNWLVTRKFTVVGDTSSDEVTLDGVTYTVRSGGNAWVTWLDNGTYVESLTIPESVTADGRTLTVNGLAPLSCYTLTRLQSLELPSTVDMLGESVLVRCGNLRSLTVNRNQPPTLVLDNGALLQFTDIDSVNCELRVPYGSKALYESANGWRKFQNIVEMNAPTDDSDIIQFADAKVKVICVANWDTDGDGELSKAEAASVTSLGGVFNRDKDITSFDEFQYFTSVKVIGQNEFMDCNGLTSIILPNSIESIEREAFYNCRIQEITIPAGVTSISYAGLYGCFSNIYVDPANQYYTSVDGVLFNKDLTTIMCYPRLRNEESYTVPSSVTVIGGCAFYSSSLSTVIIPNGVTRFETGAFRYCRQLKSIEIPETVELIESENFEGCNSLTSVFVPASVTSMAGDVFSGCTSLKEIIVDQNNPAYASVDGILYNKDLTRLCIYPGGRPDEKFEIPESVSTISYSAFIYVSNLQAIVIPKNVSQIGRFSYCSQLKSVTVYWPEPLSISDNVFGDITLTEGTLYVPYGTKTRYEAADGWKQFQNIVEMDATIDYTFDYNGVLTVRGETTMADALSAAGGTEEVAKTITAVVWAKGTPLTNSDLQGLDNPNMLVYVADASLAPSNRDNVVIGNDSTGYMAKNIMLTDVESGNNNFYCPQEFTAEMISYTRNFRQQTEVGVSRGWETIALPFQVQTIMHEKNGLLAPFGNTSSDKHFWLRQIAMDGATTGLSAATQILPNTPYLISMPNSEEYPAEYNQNGLVTFSSQNVRVPNTEPSYAQTNIPNVGMVMFVPTFSAQTANNHIYALNVLEQRGEHKEGSIFEANYRTVRPFEAYTYHEDGQRPAPRYISIGDINSGTTGIEEVRWQMSDGRSDKWYTIDGRRLQQKPTQKGVYILNGRKTIVK